MCRATVAVAVGVNDLKSDVSNEWLAMPIMSDMREKLCD